MHKWMAVVACLVLAPALAEAQGRGGGPPARPVAGHGVEVPGWWARLDDPKEITQPLKFAPAGTGVLTAVTGPTATFWDPEQYAEGQYTVRATFTQNKPASHQVAYGLFIGGTDLNTDMQRYTYFVIRQDGRYLIRRRNGATVSNLGGDWTDHPAIVKADASGKQVNELSIRVAKDGVAFMANGQEVVRHPLSAVDAVGIAGLRIGHGLDLQISGFSIQ